MRALWSSLPDLLVALSSCERPLEERRDELSRVVNGVDNIVFSEALSAEGALVFAKACKLGLEGIASKRAGSRYRSGTSRIWLKSKNPAFVRGCHDASAHTRAVAATRMVFRSYGRGVCKGGSDSACRDINVRFRPFATFCCGPDECVLWADCGPSRAAFCRAGVRSEAGFHVVRGSTALDAKWTRR
jgi:hypothetical protein